MPPILSPSKQYQRLSQHHRKKIDEEFQKILEVLLKELLTNEIIFKMDSKLYEKMVLNIKDGSDIKEEGKYQAYLQNDDKHLLRIHFRRLRRLIEIIAKYSPLLGSLMDFLLEELSICTEKFLKEQPIEKLKKEEHEQRKVQSPWIRR